MFGLIVTQLLRFCLVQASRSDQGITPFQAFRFASSIPSRMSREELFQLRLPDFCRFDGVVLTFSMIGPADAFGCSARTRLLARRHGSQTGLYRPCSLTFKAIRPVLSCQQSTLLWHKISTVATQHGLHVARPEMAWVPSTLLYIRSKKSVEIENQPLGAKGTYWD